MQVESMINAQNILAIFQSLVYHYHRSMHCVCINIYENGLDTLIFDKLQVFSLRAITYDSVWQYNACHKALCKDINKFGLLQQ